jgi:hypothetical protein
VASFGISLGWLSLPFSLHRAVEAILCASAGMRVLVHDKRQSCWAVRACALQVFESYSPKAVEAQAPPNRNSNEAKVWFRSLNPPRVWSNHPRTEVILQL